MIGGRAEERIGARTVRRWALVLALPAWVGACEATAPAPTPAASLSISPRPSQLLETDSLQLTATVRGADSSLLSGRAVHWTSSNPSLLTVDSAGVVRGTGAGAGQVWISARADAVADSTPISVLSVVLEAWPDSNLLLPGMTRTLAARFEASSGPMVSVASASWTSTDDAVVRVSATGAITAVAPGHASIVVTAGGRTARAGVEVQSYGQPLRFTNVIGSTSHVCGLTSTGAAYCWGDNRDTWLGTTQPMDRCEISVPSHDQTTGWYRYPCAFLPVRVAGGEPFVGLDLDDFSSCGWTAAGTVFCWGWYGGPTEATLVPGSVGFETVSHRCGITTTGALQCWGHNRKGRLGVGPGGPDSSATPQPVQGGLQWRAVSSSDVASCAVALDGRAMCWGENRDGWMNLAAPASSFACGTDCVDVPTEVATTMRFTDVKIGSSYACGLAADGQLYCWGAKLFQAPTPVTLVPTPAPWTAFHDGPNVCGLTAAGDGYCVPFDRGISASSFAPVVPANAPRFKQASFGGYATCGVALDGLAYCQGSAMLLGSGTRAPAPTPTLVAGQH